MERPHRKLNRLTEYDYGQEGSYFVTICTYNRAKLFHMEFSVDSKDLAYSDKETAHRPFPTVGNQIVHKWIRETENKFSDCRIDKYVIMPDHLHLIVTIQKQQNGCSLSDILCFFKTMTTNEYTRAVRAGQLPAYDKKVWQKSYYDHVIRNQQDYNEIWEYIENNPLKWRLVHNLCE